MQLGFVGLGKMGLNMVARLRRSGHEIVAFDRNAEAVEHAAATGARSASSLDALVSDLSPPRAVWIMVPSGEPTESTVTALGQRLSANDVIVDGGNSNFHDDVRRAETLARQGIHYIDAGTSGGIWGLDQGYCLMVGGTVRLVGRYDPATLAKALVDEGITMFDGALATYQGFLEYKNVGGLKQIDCGVLRLIAVSGSSLSHRGRRLPADAT